MINKNEKKYIQFKNNKHDSLQIIIEPVIYYDEDIFLLPNQVLYIEIINKLDEEVQYPLKFNIYEKEIIIFHELNFNITIFINNEKVYPLWD